MNNPDELALRKVRALWEAGSPVVVASPQERYLAGRGIWLEPAPPALRAHGSHGYWIDDPNAPDREDGSRPMKRLGRFPVLLCAVTDTASDVVAVSRIYLTADGDRLDKALDGVTDAKKCLGSPRGGMVLLTPPAPLLVVAEGVETALSVLKAVRHDDEVAVAGTLTTAGMKSLVLPDRTEALVIMADHDRQRTRPDGSSFQPGKEAAETLAPVPLCRWPSPIPSARATTGTTCCRPTAWRR